MAMTAVMIEKPDSSRRATGRDRSDSKKNWDPSRNRWGFSAARGVSVTLCSPTPKCLFGRRFRGRDLYSSRPRIPMLQGGDAGAGVGVGTPTPGLAAAPQVGPDSEAHTQECGDRGRPEQQAAG